MDPQLTYARSTAISPEHYKLVKAVEDAKSGVHGQSILIQQLGKIKQRWQTSSVSSKQAAHDLIVILYANSQRTSVAADALIDGHDPLSVEFALAGAVNLAGRAAKLTERAIGYRACDELFSEGPHELKLLLINSIRSDLYPSPGLANAEARWTLGLRATASARIGTRDLPPAVGDRVLQLFSGSSSRIRRLALAALLNLIALSPPEAQDSPSFLLSSTRRLILAALSAPPPPPPLSTRPKYRQRSSSSTSTVTSSSHHRPLPSHNLAESNPGTLLALVRALGPGSEVSPVAPAPETVRLLLGVLRRVTEGEWSGGKNDYHGVSVGWLAGGVLDGLREQLELAGEVDGGLEVEVAHAVLGYVETILDKVDLAFAVLLSACQILAQIQPKHLSPSALPAPHAGTLGGLLARVRKGLHSGNTMLRIFATRCLSALPAELWAGTGEGSEGAPPMGEPEWDRIMRGLEAKDAGLRKETLVLLQHVDPALASQRLDALIAQLQAASAPPPAGSSAPPASRAAVSALINLLLEASSVLDKNGSAWADRVTAVIDAAPKPNGVVGEAVKVTLDRFVWAPAEAQAAFASNLLAGGKWRADLSLGLLVAGTAGWGASAARDRIQAAVALATWLANKGEATSVEVVEQMQQPFLLSILRILSLLDPAEESNLTHAEDEEDNSPFSSELGDPATPARASSFLAKVDDLLAEAARAATLTTKPLFGLYTRCRTDSTAQQALGRAGADPVSATLVGFQEALERHLRATVEPRSSYRGRSGSVGSSGASSVSAPARPRRLETPLKYDAYAAPGQVEQEEKERERERRRWARQQERERRERGGKGGMGESVMEMGELRKAVADELEKDSGDELEAGGAHSFHAAEARERSWTADTDGSPPTDLLMELAPGPAPYSPTDPFEPHP